MKQTKKLFLGSALLSGIILFTACQQQAQDYRIEGNVSYPELEGKNVYINDPLSPNGHCDSTVVKEGKFVFTGKQNTPVARVIYIAESDSDFFPVELPFILENGEIEVNIGTKSKIGNTRHNDELMEFLLSIESFKEEVGKEIQENRLKAEDLNKRFSDLLVEQIVIHQGSIIGEYIFQNYQNRLNEEQKKKCEELLKISASQQHK